MKTVLLLGASGSIGSQTLDILEKRNTEFSLVGFSVGKRHEVIPDILKKYDTVRFVYLCDKDASIKYRAEYPNIKFYCGKKGLIKLVKKCSFDICVDALVGFVGMEPAILTLKKNKILCLANKEALVAGGTIINSLLANGKGKLYPIDSEHVAISKCLLNCDNSKVKKIFITASGGALRNIPLEKLKDAKACDALKHPTWKMGNKITIDCATMMNKGFEIIEAYYLFGYPLDKIEVLMHDESLIHSCIQLEDNSFVVDYGKPDMHNPIEFALTETHCDYCVKKVKSLDELKDCHFHNYDPNRYPLTELAKKCLISSASKMIALNASNEVAVNLFLQDKIKYLDIVKIVTNIVDKTKDIKYPSLRKIKYIDRKSRKEAMKCQ